MENKLLNKYKVHYAELELNSDIPIYEFTNNSELQNFILEKIYKDEETTTIILVNICGKIYISDNQTDEYTILNFILYFSDDELEGYEYGALDIFIQEYETYEEAYEVALSMKEDSKYCYKDL